MDTYRDSLSVCYQRTTDTYTALLDAIPDIMRSVPVPTFNSFEVPLGRNDGDYSLIISFPLYDQCTETSLLRSYQAVYMSQWGYLNTRMGFGTGDPADSSTIDALVAEIRRLGMNNPGHPGPDYTPQASRIFSDPLLQETVPGPETRQYSEDPQQ